MACCVFFGLDLLFCFLLSLLVIPSVSFEHSSYLSHRVTELSSTIGLHCLLCSY